MGGRGLAVPNTSSDVLVERTFGRHIKIVVSAVGEKLFQLPTEYSVSVTEPIPFAGEPADSHEAIMRATFSALQEYGYAGLSIQRIADEVDLSKSTLYHHFDGKDDLLLSFLEFLLAELDRAFRLESAGDPREDLLTLIDIILGEFPMAEETPSKETVLATYVELRGQAVRSQAFRGKISETDQRFVERLATLIEVGIEQGAFQPVDPYETAEFLLAMLNGIVLQTATREDDPLPQLRGQLEQYIEDEILA